MRGRAGYVVGIVLARRPVGEPHKHSVAELFKDRGRKPAKKQKPSTQVTAMASSTGCASRRGRAVCWLRDFDPTAVFVGQNQFLITTSPWLSGAGFGHGCAQAKQVAASAPLCAKGGWGYRRTAS